MSVNAHPVAEDVTIDKYLVVDDVEIKVVNSSLEKPSDIELIEARAHIVLRNVSSVEEKNEIVFPEMIIRGIRWNFVLAVDGSNISWYLRGADEDISAGTYHDVNVSVEALSVVYESRLYPTTSYKKYFWGMGEVTYVSAFELNEFHKKCVRNNTANFLVKFSVGEPKSLWNIEE